MRAVAVLALRSLVFLVLLTAVTGWSAVGESVVAATEHEPTSEHVFVESHASGMHHVLGFAGLLQVGIAVMLWLAGTAVRKGAGWSTTFGAVAPWSTVCCGAGALTVNPRTGVLWSGDPDGDSLTEDHFPGWHWPMTWTLLTLIVVCCMTATVALVAVRRAERRR